MDQAIGRRRAGLISPWSVLAAVIAVLVLLPILAVLWIALTPEENIWPHLLATTLPRYLTNTLVLMVLVGAISATVGSVTAWLVTMYRFPLSGLLKWALLMPLATPAYVGAYAIVDFLEYAGPFQSSLRSLFGWETPSDYWFFEVRSRGMAALVLGSTLFPYTFLLTRAALREQSGAAYEVARALGAGPIKLFFRVGLPLARPAIAAGATIAMMETVAEFGVMEYFAVQTLTTGIFSIWLQGNNAGGAAQIALVTLVLIVALVAIEKTNREKLRFHQTARQSRVLIPLGLTGWRGGLACVACLVPFAFGFILPVAVMSYHAWHNASEWLDPRLISALWNTTLVASLAAVITTFAGLAMVYGVRLTGRRLPRLLLPLTTIGYAAPGAVLAIGILLPMSAVDHLIADAIEAATGVDVGLLMTGSAFAIVFACCVRFFAISQGAADAAMGRVSPSLPMAARSLGRSENATLRSVYLPMIRASVGTALLLVFVDSVKELPATLLLRPFNFNTLATRVYEKASLENIGDAAPPSLIIILVGLSAVIVLARTSR